MANLTLTLQDTVVDIVDKPHFSCGFIHPSWLARFLPSTPPPLETVSPGGLSRSQGFAVTGAELPKAWMAPAVGDNRSLDGFCAMSFKHIF